MPVRFAPDVRNNGNDRQVLSDSRDPPVIEETPP